MRTMIKWDTKRVLIIACEVEKVLNSLVDYAVEGVIY